MRVQLKSASLFLMTFGMLFCFALPLVLAGPASVTNNGNETVAVATKTADGQYGMVLVDAGQTVNLPEDVERIKVNGNQEMNVIVTKTDGKTIKMGPANSGESTAVKPETPATVARTHQGTLVIPTHTQAEIVRVFGTGASIRANTGVGLPASPTDGPVTYVGLPLGRVGGMPPSPGQDEVTRFLDAQELTPEDMEELSMMGFKTDRQIYDFLHTEMGFAWYWSGSGGMFGDTVGVDVFNGAYRPGFGRSGPTLGRDIDFGLTKTVFNSDSFLESALHSNFSTFTTNFRNLYGEFQEDTHGDAYAG